MSQIIDKPWGKEIIYTNADSPYTLKMMYINAGNRLSLQSHTEKIETFVLISGKADLVIGKDLNTLETISMEIEKEYNIIVGTIHRMVAISDCKIFEGSTPETGTTIRYQDDFKRPDETEEIRQKDNRGWSNNNIL